MPNGIRFLTGALCVWMLAGWNAPVSAVGNVQRGAARRYSGSARPAIPWSPVAT